MNFYGKHSIISVVITASLLVTETRQASYFRHINHGSKEILQNYSVVDETEGNNIRKKHAHGAFGVMGRQMVHNCEQCGIGNPAKIIGGEEATASEFPWMVQIISNQSFLCGGTLIGSNYVMTAAHCFAQTRHSLKVILGTHLLTPKAAGPITIKVIAVIKHPLFDPTKSKANDIALLKLEDPVTFDRTIRPICLPTTDQHLIGKNGTVTGWGRQTLNGQLSEHLIKLNLPVVGDEECREKWYGKTLPAGAICAGYVFGRKDSCIGDSGGPLAVKQDGVWYQVGIVSWGASESCALTYGVYTRVTSFSEWITKNMQDDKCQLNAQSE